MDKKAAAQTLTDWAVACQGNFVFHALNVKHIYSYGVIKAMNIYLCCVMLRINQLRDTHKNHCELIGQK